MKQKGQYPNNSQESIGAVEEAVVTLQRCVYCKKYFKKAKQFVHKNRWSMTHYQKNTVKFVEKKFLSFIWSIVLGNG